MEFSQIIDRVREIRGENTFDAKSVRTYLFDRKKDFLLLENNKYILLDWVDKRKKVTQKPRRTKTIINNFEALLEEVMKLNETKPLSEIVSFFKNKGFVDITVRNRLDILVKKGFLIDVTPIGKRNRILQLVNNNFFQEKRETLRDRVHNSILIELRKMPNRKITKNELYALVCNHEPDLKRHVFYSYLSSLKDPRVITFKENNGVYVLLTED